MYVKFRLREIPSTCAYVKTMLYIYVQTYLEFLQIEANLKIRRNEISFISTLKAPKKAHKFFNLRLF